MTNAQGVLDATVATLNGLLATLNGLLAQVQSLLNGLAATLGLQPLLSIEGVQVGAVATAKDTVANSTATATGVIGDIKLGGIDLGGLDIEQATVGQVQSLLSSLTSQLNSVLTTISPSLTNLVTVDLLQKTTEVSQSGDYVRAVAGIAGLVATVTPPDICSLLSDVLSNVPNGLAGNTLPGVSLPATPLPEPAHQPRLGHPQLCRGVGACGCPRAAAIPALPAFPALLTPITLTAAEANSVSEFKSVAQGTDTTTTTTQTPGTPIDGPALSRTGMNETLLLIIGGLMAAAARGASGRGTGTQRVPGGVEAKLSRHSLPLKRRGQMEQTVLIAAGLPTDFEPPSSTPRLSTKLSSSATTLPAAAAVLLVSAAFFEGYDSSILALLLPNIQSTFHVSEAVLGITRIPIELGLFVAFFVARLSDRRRAPAPAAVVGRRLHRVHRADRVLWDIWSLRLLPVRGPHLPRRRVRRGVTMIVEEFPADRRGERARHAAHVRRPRHDRRRRPARRRAAGRRRSSGGPSTSSAWCRCSCSRCYRRRIQETRRFLEEKAAAGAGEARKQSFLEPWKPQYRRNLVLVGLVHMLRSIPLFGTTAWWAFYAERERGFRRERGGHVHHRRLRPGLPRLLRLRPARWSASVAGRPRWCTSPAASCSRSCSSRPAQGGELLRPDARGVLRPRHGPGDGRLRHRAVPHRDPGPVGGVDPQLCSRSPATCSDPRWSASSATTPPAPSATSATPSRLLMVMQIPGALAGLALHARDQGHGARGDQRMTHGRRTPTRFGGRF